jgi:hypothetical protein
VLHHALADYLNWPEATKIIGGKFYIASKPGERNSGWKEGQQVHVRIADPNHPITRFMKDFDIQDETYKDYDILPECKPLLFSDNPTSDKVIAWTHTYARSPVAYIQLGHGPAAYTNPSYRRLVAQAIRWAAGRLPDPSEKGFKPLFNGKDLDDWKIFGRPAGFVVKDGILHSDSGKDGQYMFFKKEFADFILRVEWRISKGGNSGVFIRSPFDAYPWDAGFEVQISNEPRDEAHCTGSLYSALAVNPRPDETAEVWHEFEIRCIGSRVTVFADNIPVVDADAKTVPQMKTRPLKGYVGLQDSHNPDGWVEFRKVIIKELSPAASPRPKAAN